MVQYTFISDVHIGSKYCLYDYFEEAIKNPKNKNIIICGDLFDCGLHGDMRFDQEMNVEESIEYAYRVLKGSKRLFGIIVGNHEWRIVRETGIDPCKILCDKLKIGYMGTWYENEDVFVTHGVGNANTVEGEFRRWLKWSNAKYIVKGHSHNLYYHPFPSFSDIRLGIAAGCMKIEGAFEERNALTCTNGYIRLNTEKTWNNAVQIVI